MIEALSRRSFLSTALGFTFVPVAVTGVLMLFHIHFPGIKDIHDWVGLAFVIVGIFHLLINWKPFQRYLGKTDARVALALALILTVVCGVMGATGDSGRHDKARHAAYAKFK